MSYPRESAMNVKLPGVKLDADPPPSHRATEKQCPQPNDNVEFADAASTSPEVEDRQHPTLWFQDGSLTVVASDGMRFKLHPGLLAHHSDILQERIAILSSPGTSQAETALRLAIGVNHEMTLNLPDNGDDLAELFNMIYNGNTQSVYYNFDTRITFAHFHRILRLGVKYKVQHIMKSGFARLEQAFPPDYDRWRYGDTTYHKHSCPIEVEPMDIIPLIILARDAGCTRTLPVMLYVCTSKVDLRYLLKGVSHASETYKLDIADQMACIDARRRLQMIEDGTKKIFIRGAFDGPTSQCTTRQACIAVYKHMALTGEEDELLHDGQPLVTWDEWLYKTGETIDEGELCTDCKWNLQSELWSYFRKEWERLGEIFNVPDWTPSM